VTFEDCFFATFVFLTSICQNFGWLALTWINRHQFGKSEIARKKLKKIFLGLSYKTLFVIYHSEKESRLQKDLQCSLLKVRPGAQKLTGENLKLA
jgi:hypothetical protein